jgi:diacylglycerol kinase (ATP)
MTATRHAEETERGPNRTAYRSGKPFRDIWTKRPLVRRIIRATINTLNGLRSATATEAAFRQELIALAIAVPLAFVIATDRWTFVLLVGVVLALLIVELLNTAIEKLADRITLDQDPVIGRVKDLGSAAVGVTLLLVGFVWLVALWGRAAALLS